MSTQTFTTQMLLMGNNTGIEVPAEVVEALGSGCKPAVVVTVNGYEYRSTVAVMGGRNLIPFSSDKRAATGIGGGDAIEVVLKLDTEPRTVMVPDDLAAALAVAGLTGAFEKVAPSQKKAHVLSVESAKAPETRQRRIDAIVAKVGGV